MKKTSVLFHILFTVIVLFNKYGYSQTNCSPYVVPVITQVDREKRCLDNFECQNKAWNVSINCLANTPQTCNSELCPSLVKKDCPTESYKPLLYTEKLWCCPIKEGCICKNCKKPECNANGKSVFFFNTTKTGQCCKKWTCVTKREGNISFTTAESAKPGSIAFNYTSSEYNTNMDPTVTTMYSKTSASSVVSSTTSLYYTSMEYNLTIPINTTYNNYTTEGRIVTTPESKIVTSTASTTSHYNNTTAHAVHTTERTKKGDKSTTPKEDLVIVASDNGDGGVTKHIVVENSTASNSIDVGGISTIMIVVIVICVVVALLIVGALTFWILKRKRKNNTEKGERAVAEDTMDKLSRGIVKKIKRKKIVIPTKVKPAPINPKEFKYKGPLKIHSGTKGSMRHVLEGEKSSSLKEPVEFDTSLNEIVLIGTDVELVEPSTSASNPDTATTKSQITTKSTIVK